MPKKLEQDPKLAAEQKCTEDKTPADLAKDVEQTLPSDYKPTIQGEIYRLEDLNGVGPKTAEKLRELGYSVVSMATARPDELQAEMKVTFIQAKSWINQAQEAVLAKMELHTAPNQDQIKKDKVFYIKTGSENFNSLLGGGIPTWGITGLSGRFASGKTQTVNDAIVSCLAFYYTCPKCYRNLEVGTLCPKCKVVAVKAKAALIETEPDTFNLDRLKEIAEGRKLSHLINWDDLFVCGAEQIPTPKAQFLQYRLIQKAIDRGENIHLICVDSFTARFRPGYGKSEMLPIRTREFAEHFQLMEYMANAYNIAWLLTCQVIAAPRPDQGLGNMMKYGDQFYAVGGEYMYHSVNNWIGLTQVKVELWKATLFDSSHLARRSVDFIITKEGLKDGVR